MNGLQEKWSEMQGNSLTFYNTLIAVGLAEHTHCVGTKESCLFSKCITLARIFLKFLVFVIILLLQGEKVGKASLMT